MSRKVIIKYVGPVLIYKIIDQHNYLLMILDGENLRGLDLLNMRDENQQIYEEIMGMSKTLHN